MKKLLTIVMCLVVALTTAQTKIKRADKFYKGYSFSEAAKLYDEALADKPNPGAETLMKAGDSHYNIGQKREALKYYQMLYDIQGSTMPQDYFIKYTESIKASLDYAKADKVTREYLSAKGDNSLMAKYALQKKQMDSLAKEKPLYTIKTLDVNSNKSDFGTAFYGQKIVYASAKDTTKYDQKLYNWNQQPFLDLYVAERNVNDGTLLNVQPFLSDAMTKYHDATAAFSPDLKTVYYTRNIVKNNKKLVNDKTGTNQFKIVRGTVSEDGKLGKLEDMQFNDNAYSTGHPAVSNDGKWLFFASDMPGGQGGSDIYVAEIDAAGTVGPAKNLGPMVNTPGEEMFPFLSNGMLYFASDGHFGWGGLDIYESKMTGAMNFSEPRNLGAPINSNKDDFALIVDPTDKFGYFSSNREMGKGDDDIYYFTKAPVPCDELISGKVTNAKSKLPIGEATVSVTDMMDTPITSATTDANGDYVVTVPCGKKYKIAATKANHSREEKQLEIGKKNGNQTKDVNFELTNYDDLITKKGDVEKITVNPIYFEYDKWNITALAEVELDKVVFAMTKFPNLKIKIESHTDSRGKDAYNMKLSDNRAKSTRDYIISKGIDASRIESAIGYGESRLTNRCKNGVKCSEAEHLANRRSDFIVIDK
ncbi:OmpA family protein [Flavobacterium sp. MAH-1]|uniref:OmpA family protein n=1 Tax=Flavobacterium agri TaxID=2743471 RepID=A0A7Y8Y1F8_9FLAO|nr:OmpA family protein [Flavobacterium agri]NUY79520.1 OmpA family protein [Flavobacterium agri]NYA69545.1 OmpA family protein [Flavobacterium agri]